MKNQIILVMGAMLVTVFVVPAATLTLIVNVGTLALLLTTLIPLAGTAINLHLENKWRVRNESPVVKDTDGNQPTKEAS
jgi:hypothetical protein